MDRRVEKITSRSNKVCLHFKKLGVSKSYREEHKQFLCDGEKLLNEAINSGMVIDCVLSSLDIKQELPDSVKVYHVSDSLIESLSPLKNTRNILFTCKIPKPTVCSFISGTHILLDTIQDPGNVGTIIRSAHAFGIDSVIIRECSADIYNPKTIRASMGAVFKQRICVKNVEEIHELKKAGLKILGADNCDDSKDIRNVSLDNVIIVLGNEGQGITTELLELCDEMITIPLTPNCESLNVAAAAAIIMWEASKE